MTLKLIPLITLTIFTFVLVGCSGSSGSTSTDGLNAAENDNAGLANEAGSPIVSPSNQPTLQFPVSESEDTDSVPAVDTTVVVEEGSTEDAVQEESTDDTVQEQSAEDTVEAESVQVVPDPELPAATRVDFEINVPTYSSNELLVQMVWGDIQADAEWVAGELWILSEEFPIDTERELVVTFFDRNGDVTLASFETTFRTGFNSVDDQFDSARWDTDGDGVSNLDESILGGDSVQAELRENYFDFDFQLRTDTYESQVPDERPYFEHLDIMPGDLPDGPPPPLGITQTLTIDIDESGNGTHNEFSRNFLSSNSVTTWNYAATRTHAGDSVSWVGESDRSFNGDVSEFFTSSVETERVDARALRAEGAYSFLRTGVSPVFFTDIEYALTGDPIADSASCEPVSGLVTEGAVSFDGEAQVWVQEFNTISKRVDDQFWTVVESEIVSVDFPSMAIETAGDPIEGSEVVDSYLTRMLGVTFYCDYPELR